jgi:hypothetical protein
MPRPAGGIHWSKVRDRGEREGRREVSPWTIFLCSATELLHDVILQEDLEAGMVSDLIVIFLNVRVEPELIFVLKVSEHHSKVFMNFRIVQESFGVRHWEGNQVERGKVGEGRNRNPDQSLLSINCLKSVKLFGSEIRNRQSVSLCGRPERFPYPGQQWSHFG